MSNEMCGESCWNCGLSDRDEMKNGEKIFKYQWKYGCGKNGGKCG